MPKNDDDDYTVIVANKKFEVHVLDPKKDRRDNVRLTLHPDDGAPVAHAAPGQRRGRRPRTVLQVAPRRRVDSRRFPGYLQGLPGV